MACLPDAQTFLRENTNNKQRKITWRQLVTTSTVVRASATATASQSGWFSQPVDISPPSYICCDSLPGSSLQTLQEQYLTHQ